MNPFFELAEPREIAEIDSLLSLNIQKLYYKPADETPVANALSIHSFPHASAGIFRGQIRQWPLVPKCYRDDQAIQQPVTEIALSFKWGVATRKLREFCERAEAQNPAFPKALSDRMSIAQHFGVATPLLDWSQNVLTAAFFAIRNVFLEPDFVENPQVFIYHVRDERLLHDGLPDTAELTKFAKSAFIKPYPIDRRIERQRGVFTYHPHPARQPERVPADVYVLEWHLVDKLLKLMKGFGFTDDYFFPDYAGIAEAVNRGSSI